MSLPAAPRLRSIPGGLPRRRLLLTLASSGLLPGAWAQAGYPNRALIRIVPYPAGASADIGGRLLAGELARQLGQPVVVENVSGASGALGMQKLARAPADGYTLVYAGLSEGLLVPQIQSAVGYRPEELSALALAGSSPVGLLARPDFPANTIDELIALVRSRPGHYSFGSGGIGSFAHVMSEVIKERTGTFMVHIPYRGGAQIMTDLIGGQIDLAITTVVGAASMLASKRLKMLGVTARGRLPAFPDIPTFEESRALKGVDMQVWAIVFGPAGLSEPVTGRLNAAINASLGTPAMLAALGKLGAETPPRTLGLAETRAFLQTQAAFYQPVTRRIKPE